MRDDNQGNGAPGDRARPAGSSAPGDLAVARDVTAAKLSEQRLRNREQQLLEAEAIAGFGSWELDLRANVVTWSEGLFRILGLEPATFEPELQSYMRFVHADDAPSLAETLRAARTAGSYKEEHRIVLQNGDVRFMQGRGRVVRDEQGRPVRLVGTVHDISDRKSAEQQNRLLARVTRTISEATDVDSGLAVTLRDLCESGSWDYGEFWFPAENGLELACHDASYSRDAVTTALFRKESLEGRRLPDASLPGRVWKRGVPEWYSNMTEDESVFYRHEGARQVGLKTCVGVPLAMLDTVVGVLVLLRHEATPRDERELTVLTATAAQLGVLIQRKRDEHALRVSEERLQFATRASSDVILDWDLQTNGLWIGEALGRTFGYQAKVTDISWWTAFIHPDDRPQVLLALRTAIEGEQTLWSGEYRFLRSDGRYAHVFDRGYILRSPEGKALRMIRSMMDVSERVREAEVLREAKESAEDAARVKSQFLANMSHEIRTPLTAVLGFADLLLDPKMGSSDRMNYAMIIRRNGEHLLAVLNDILDISKVEAGKLTIEKIECSPAQTLADVASLMRVRATEKGLSFDIEYDGPMPAAVRTDPTRLRQIVLNLVSNAIKFTERGGVRIVAHCEGEERNRTMVIRVMDTGIGMETEQMDRLFQPFSQADPSMTRRYGGSGLGLGICAPLAAALGGGIDVESTPARGSTFTLRLPVEVLAGTMMFDHPREALVNAESEIPPAVPVSLRPVGGLILLAEDGLDNQALIGTLLRRRGFDVTVVENGRLAVEGVLHAAAANRAYDVVLMDMQMPELDGYGATAQLRTRGYRGAIIALTAHAMAGERERCFAAGCDDYLAKPIDRAQLIAAVRAHVDRAHPSAPPHGQAVPDTAPPPKVEVVAAERLVSDFVNDPDIADIVAIFVSGLPTKVSSLLEAAEREDRGLVLRIAHQLKGAAGGYGFPLITALAGKLEDLAKSSAAPLTQAIEELAVLCQRTQVTAVLEQPALDRSRRPVLLVVDDSPHIQDLIETRLRTEQVTVHKASSAADGLRLAYELAPDLVLLDIDLPDADGFEVCRALKADPRTASTPVLFLTGTSDAAIKATALDLGAVDYVTKPFDATELRARVRSALRIKRYHDLLATRAHVDGLTGVWNRMHFDSRLAEEVSSAVRYDRALAIVMLDIDHFKNVNDSHGHPFGDRVLQAVAAALVKTVRASDIVCRYGGEELVVILRETGATAGVLACERMRRAVAALSFAANFTSVSVTASLGVVASEPAGALGRAALQPETMVAAADLALYAAKRAGRNRVVLGTMQ